MHTTSDLSVSPLSRGVPTLRRRFRIPRAIRVIAGAAVALAALGLLFAAEPPGAAIRSGLAAGAAALDRLPVNASDKTVTDALLPAFADWDAFVDTAGYPSVVAVTLQGIDRRSCVAALHSARRLEGKVVVQLDGYRSSADCGDNNAMTWRLMP